MLFAVLLWHAHHSELGHVICSLTGILDMRCCFWPVSHISSCVMHRSSHARPLAPGHAWAAGVPHHGMCETVLLYTSRKRTLTWPSPGSCAGRSRIDKDSSGGPCDAKTSAEAERVAEAEDMAQQHGGAAAKRRYAERADKAAHISNVRREDAMRTRYYAELISHTCVDLHLRGSRLP